MEDIDVLIECIDLIIESSSRVRRDFFSDVSSLQTTDAEVPSEFKQSLLTSSDGKPFLFFHGTKKQFDTFSKEFANTSGTNVSTNYLGFFFTTSEEVAKIYASKRFDVNRGLAKTGRIDAFVLNVKKPYFVTEKTYWDWSKGAQNEMQDFVEMLKSKGFDSIIMPSVWRGRQSGAYDVVVFDSNQIYKIT